VSQEYSLTENRKHALIGAVSAAYFNGWNGKLSQTSKRPYLDLHRRYADKTAARYLEKVGLARRLSKGGWFSLYLTGEAIRLAERLWGEEEGNTLTIKESALRRKAEQAEREAETERLVQEACHHFRGLTIRRYEGDRPRAISTKIRALAPSPRRRGEFSLSLAQIIELGKQIEELRSA
jgi:hypothetical protein